MEAMILAAGLGTRLGPLTRERPKALMQVGERPLLAWVVERLVASGVTRIIINTHHEAQQIEDWVHEQGPPGIDFVLSPEPAGPYETGGGLFRAQGLFQESSPFLVHNVDVLSRIPLTVLMEKHGGNRAGRGISAEYPAGKVVASLAVQQRPASRVLLFDDLGLMGWENHGRDGGAEARKETRKAQGTVVPWAFTGIHVVEPAIFRLSRRSGRFSIITLYLELARAGFVIRPVDVTGHLWMDVGTPESLREARDLFS